MNMKHITALLFAAVTLPTFAQARVEWVSETIDFGAFREEAGPVTAVFRGVNTGTEPLVILSARANCGCTTPKYRTVAYAPGDTAEVEVTYDPQGRPGRFKKYVYVDTNTSPERSKLTVQGVVIGEASTLSGRYPVEAGPLRLAAPAVLLGRVQKGHVKTVFSGAYNSSVDSVTPAFADLPKWIDVTAAPPTVGPGEQTSFNFFVRPDRTPLYGVVSDTITVYPDASDKTVSMRLPVVATIEEDFSKLTDKELTQAPQVSFPDGKRISLDAAQTAAHCDAAGNLTVSCTVANSGKSPLLVRRVQTTGAGVSARISATKIKPGKTAELTLTVSAKALAEGGNPFATRVILITNDPLNPSETLRLAAAVK